MAGGVLRGFLRFLAVIIAAAPFVLVALLSMSGTTSLAVVSPSGLWMLAAIFVVPVLLGIAIWRLSALVR
jgi:hypothetical protein